MRCIVTPTIWPAPTSRSDRSPRSVIVACSLQRGSTGPRRRSSAAPSRAPERRKRTPSKRSSVVTFHSWGAGAETSNCSSRVRDQVIGPYSWSHWKAVRSSPSPNTFHAW
jgi:hypothetical protein